MTALAVAPRPVHRCPTGATAPDGTRHTTVGCGSTNIDGPDEEGAYDCLNCGIWFNPADEIVTAPFHPQPTVYAAGATFHLRRTGIHPDTPYALRIQTDRVLSGDDARHLAALVGYAYRAEVRGEPVIFMEQDSHCSIVLAADTTKTASDDLGVALDRFEKTLSTVVVEGSPIRKTDRQGVGTRGTRKVVGFGPIRFALYYDDIMTRTAAAVPLDIVICGRHGGQWGDDLTCPRCTDDDGEPRPFIRP